MKVWITRYALTEGIIEGEGILCKTSEGMIEIMLRPGDYRTTYIHRPHWHGSREQAVKYAELMRESKIKSLRKSIEKMKKLTF